MNPHEHIDELADLYALGTLDAAERSSVDARVRTCAVCAARLGESESFIAATAGEAEPSPQSDRRIRGAFAQQRPYARRWATVAAAAFVVGLLPGVLFGMLHRPAAPFDADRSNAIAALAGSHFLHAAFTPLAGGSLKAKVIYGRTTPWRFLVAQTNHAYRVEARTPAGSTFLGTMHVNGNAAELYVPNSTARTFLLLDGTRPIARIHLP